MRERFAFHSGIRVFYLYSVKFLADTYLKYIGWMLYDKVGEVRVACLNVLEPLYSDPDTAPHLELFTEKFKVSKLSDRLSVLCLPIDRALKKNAVCHYFVK